MFRKQASCVETLDPGHFERLKNCRTNHVIKYHVLQPYTRLSACINPESDAQQRRIRRVWALDRPKKMPSADMTPCLFFRFRLLYANSGLAPLLTRPANLPHLSGNNAL
ncbi:predicted protein [Sclerotinia sclerotiorum 1980 UF-70]|uniref:Uncharacterized protein n=1 Tax=Sclerotinia sclerotiorum (strain ATCC 18683 / 1980 / Ss-1) TaxID=665079 RepID=A7F8H1_SCLS1|nr:predicted protein [Sclerotinia sclerotiorum 1980 UF-70]EDN99042.1 predicted protein [Sclerotinia sclerotiorum 1980 UF-70]